MTTSPAPPELVVIVVFAAVIICWFSITVMRMNRLNAISLYLAIWSAVLLLYGIPWLDLRPLTVGTLQFISVGALALVAGSICAWLVSRKTLAPGRESATEFPVYDDRRLVRFHLVAVAALAGYALLQIILVLPDIKAAGGLQAIFGGSGIDVRRAFLSAAIASSQTSFGGGSLLVSIVGYVLFLGTISVFWSGYLARRGRYVLAVLPLLVLALESLILLQRADFVYPFLLFGFSWMYHRGVPASRPNAGPSRRPLLIAVLAPLVATVLIVPLLIRQPGTSGSQTAQSIATYFVGGVAGLNALSIDDSSLASAASPITGLKAPTSSNYPTPLRPLPVPTQGGGAWSFFGAASVLTRLGFPIGTPSNFFAFVTIQAQNGGVINVYTYLLFAYYDFGFLGIILIPFLLGIVATAVDRQVRIQHRWALIPAAAILMTTVAMTFFSLTLTRDLRYDVLLLVAPFIGRRVLGQSRPPRLQAGQRRHVSVPQQHRPFGDAP